MIDKEEYKHEICEIESHAKQYINTLKELKGINDATFDIEYTEVWCDIENQYKISADITIKIHTIQIAEKINIDFVIE